MEICKYYHNAQAPVILSIDDLSFTAILSNGKLRAADDWGYGLNEANGIWRYLEDTLFKFYPEVRGTIFFPLNIRHGVQNLNAGYDVVFRENKEEIAEFFKCIQQSFEIAFHGTNHGRYKDVQNPQIADNWQQEFEYLTLSDVAYLKEVIKNFEHEYNIKFTGGKYPGYRDSDVSEEIIQALGFSWWMRKADMCGKRCKDNDYAYFGKNRQILDIPTNVDSSIFRRQLNVRRVDSLKIRLKQKIPFVASMWATLKKCKKEVYIEYLYDNSLPITIQSHFSSMRTDGYRQTPALYDDMESLLGIYALIRGADVWYTTCGDLSEYIHSYNQAVLLNMDNKYKLSFRDGDTSRKVTVSSNYRRLKREEDGRVIFGCYHRGKWLYDDLGAGIYVGEE